MLSGSVAQLPERLLELIKPGGCLMAVVGAEPMMRTTWCAGRIVRLHPGVEFIVRRPLVELLAAYWKHPGDRAVLCWSFDADLGPRRAAPVAPARRKGCGQCDHATLDRNVPPMIDQVSPSDLPRWLQAASTDAGPPLLLDVREPAEWATASAGVDGAELLQLPMHLIPSRACTNSIPTVPSPCCATNGGRSMQVALFLTQRGFEHVANVAGGIDAWSLQVDPAVPRY